VVVGSAGPAVTEIIGTDLVDHRTQNRIRGS
jgi:hypothetical protein